MKPVNNIRNHPWDTASEVVINRWGVEIYHLTNRQIYFPVRNLNLRSYAMRELLEQGIITDEAGADVSQWLRTADVSQWLRTYS